MMRRVDRGGDDDDDEEDDGDDDDDDDDCNTDMKKELVPSKKELLP